MSPNSGSPIDESCKSPWSWLRKKKKKKHDPQSPFPNLKLWQRSRADQALHLISDQVQDQANKNGASLSISCNSNSWLNLNHVFFSFRNQQHFFPMILQPFNCTTWGKSHQPYMAAMNDIASVTWPRSSSSKKWCDNSSNLRLLTLPWDLMEGEPQKNWS